MKFKRHPAANRRAVPRPETWELRLYVTDRTPLCITALANLKAICEAHLSGHYRITVVDLLEHPDRAKEESIVAIPTVDRWSPGPRRRVVGDLSDAGRVLSGLDLHERVAQRVSD